MRSITDLVRLLFAYMRLNLAAQLEYRAAFLTQVIAMFINDGVWVIFWVVFFSRFPVLRGWTKEDVITVWSITAAGFGLGMAGFGNSMWLATFITQGQLDSWLLYPRPVLPHLLVGRMLTSAWGDTLFGYIVYVVFVHPSLIQFFMFICLSVSVAMLFVGFCILVSSLAFFLGNAVAILDQGMNALITFSTYPAVIFDGGIKLVLFTLIPSAFVSYLPVEALRQLSPAIALLSVVGSAFFLSCGVLLFYRGLKRYESGNLMEMRG